MLVGPADLDALYFCIWETDRIMGIKDMEEIAENKNFRQTLLK